VQQQSILYNLEKNALFMEAVSRGRTPAVHYFYEPVKKQTYVDSSIHGYTNARTTRTDGRVGCCFHKRYE